MGAHSSSAVKAEQRTEGRSGTFGRVVLPILLVLAGLCVMLYPVVATQWNNAIQRGVTNEYLDQLEQQSPEQTQAALEAARTFNQANAGRPILDPWLARIADDNEDYQAYAKQLSSSVAMSQVVIPSIDVNLPVYHGTSPEVLNKGLGHLYGTALPVGGEGTHSVITGHTGLTNATLFDNLSKVKVGDSFYINTYGEQMKYEVEDIRVVLPEEVDTLRPEPGRDLVTLITCTPYGINSHRLLVTGHRVPLDPSEQKVFDRDSFSWQWWMIAAIIASLVALVLLVWWLWRGRRRTPSEDSE